MTSCPYLRSFSSRIWSKTVLIYPSNLDQDVANLNLRLDSRIYSVDENLLIKEFYSLEKGKITSKIVTRLSGKNSTKEIEYIWQRRSNLSQFEIKIVYAQAPPYLEVELKENGFVFKGVFGGVFRLLLQQLGFQYSLVNYINGQVDINYCKCSNKIKLHICT